MSEIQGQTKMATEARSWKKRKEWETQNLEVVKEMECVRGGAASGWVLDQKENWADQIKSVVQLAVFTNASFDNCTTINITGNLILYSNIIQ